MPVTININNLTLCHKGSNGISTATIPDVCKTPSPGGPVPIPYPNIAFSSDLAKGTKTVTADGGNMCAIYGSEFSKSTGDEPGTVGGVKSGTFIKEATWITYSFDVKLEGQGACRLTDKMFHNHGNTVNASGLLQMYNLVKKYPILEEICQIICACALGAQKSNRGMEYDDCVKNELHDRNEELGGKYTAKAQNAYDMRGKPKVIPSSDDRPISPRLAAQVAGKGNVRIPDVSIVKDGSLPAEGKNLLAIVEIKFKDRYSEKQKVMDKKFETAGVKVIGPLYPEDCGCGALLEEEPRGGN